MEYDDDQNYMLKVRPSNIGIDKEKQLLRVSATNDNDMTKETDKLLKEDEIHKKGIGNIPLPPATTTSKKWDKFRMHLKRAFPAEDGISETENTRPLKLPKLGTSSSSTLISAKTQSDDNLKSTADKVGDSGGCLSNKSSSSSSSRTPSPLMGCGNSNSSPPSGSAVAVPSKHRHYHHKKAMVAAISGETTKHASNNNNKNNNNRNGSNNKSNGGGQEKEKKSVSEAYVSPSGSPSKTNPKKKQKSKLTRKGKTTIVCLHFLCIYMNDCIDTKAL